MKMRMLSTAVALATLSLGLMSTGCDVEIDDDDGYYDDDDGRIGAGAGVNNGAGSDAFYATVDRGVVLSTDLGEGAGVFVEYSEGGVWTVWTSCDSLQSDLSCLWDIHVSTQAPLALDADGNLLVEVNDGEREQDVVEVYSDYDLSFYTETSYGSDAMTFVTEPKALVEFEIVLDGFTDPTFLRWSFNGEVQPGAPYGPVVLQPDAP